MTSHHMCIDIRGFLKNSGKKSFNGLFKDDFGHPIKGSVAKDMLRIELAKGKSLMLIGKVADCPNFDPYEKGCPGHDIQPEVNT